MKLDAKDRKLLACLDKDSRLSFSELAKKTGMPQETVRYRFNRLSKEFIEYFPTFINGPKIGITYYQILFKLHNINRKKFDEFMNYLCKETAIGWVAEIEGSYDVAIIVHSRNQYDVHSVVDRIYTTYSDVIWGKELSLQLHGEFYPREWLLNESRDVVLHTPRFIYEKPIELKPYEQGILAALANDSRAGVVYLSEKVGVSVETVVEAVKRLRKQKIILGQTIVLKLDKLGVSHYKIVLRLNNVTEKDFRALALWTRSRKRVLGLFRALAHFDYEIDVEVETPQELKEITMELNTHFSHIIHDYEVLRIVHMYKYNFYP